MKNFIKNLLRESLLQERLMDVDDDVDMIYDMYYKDAYEQIEKTGSLIGVNFPKVSKSSDILNYELSKKAHEVNPVTIKLNEFRGNFYHPKKSIISITYPKNAYNFIMENADGDIEKAMEMLPEHQAKSISREFKEESIKGSIHHELVHWIDDSLHNKHIEKVLSKAEERGIQNVNAKYFELQSQIHNIKQLKNKNSEIWDEISFDELISMSPALSIVYRNLPNDVRKKWKLKLKKRMHREGLLGDNMVN